MKNPLDKFQSHSVHYVMLAARSTEDVRRFTVDSPQAQSETLSAIDGARQLGDVVRVGAGTEAFLMMDTRRFAQFGISDFELDTMLAGFAVPGSKSPSSVAVGMKFTVVDSMGISFANFLQYLMDQKLQVSFDGMTVLVRVLFIGHKSDGSTEVVQSLTIPANFNQIQMDLNEVKGLYHCTLFPLIGMASNSAMNHKWTTIGTASSYFTGVSANTLGAVVNSFERRLNEESLKRYTQLNAQTQKEGVKTTVGRYGRPVQFMITLPKGWDDFPFSGPTQGNVVETVFTELVKKEKDTSQSAANAQKKTQQNANAPAKDSYVSVDPSLSITEVLDVIFGQCLDVAKLGNFTHKQDTDGSLKFYKHLITVTSDNESFTVHVDVVEFIVPNVDLATGSGASSVSPNDQDLYTSTPMPDGSMKRTPKQYIEYDYIFSGKNLDVLNLDIKIENLNVLLMQGSKLGQGQLFKNVAEGQNQGDGESVAKDEHPIYGRRAKDPALMPARSGGDKTNYSNLAANAKTDGDATPQAVNQQYIQNLQAFYAAGPVDAKMVLRGNPDLMVMVALQSIPQHVSAITITSDGGAVSKTNQSVKTAYRTAFEKDLLRLNGISDGQSGGVNYSNEGRRAVGSPINTQMLTGRNFVSSPVFAKVNVFGPNVDFLTGTANVGDYAQQLFYDNYYFVHQLVSKIDGARFTQEVSLRSFSLYSFPNTSAAGAGTNTVKDK
jgi:hypothetical protein